MFRVTSLAKMPEAQLNRWIKRVGLLLFLGLVAFVAFYAIDRVRFSPAPIVDQELATAETAVRDDPADVVARGQLADLYFAKSRYEEAIGQYTVLIDAGQEVETASLMRGRAYQKTGQLDLAVPDFQKVVEIASTGEMASVDPMLAAGYYGLGTTLVAQGKPHDAIEPFESALAIQKTDADVLYALGAALLADGQVETAIERLTTAVTMVPNGWAEPYFALETAYTQQGDAAHAEWAGAMAAFAAGDAELAEERLLKIADGGLALEAAVGLGVLKEATGDTGAAGDWYRKALAIDADNTAAKLGLGRVTLPVASPAEGNP